MNVKAINDIGDLIHVRNKFGFTPARFPFFELRKMTAKEIIESRDFKVFQRCYPELTKCVLE